MVLCVLFYRQKWVFVGETMGSTYRIILYTPLWRSASHLHPQIDSELADFTSIFSTYTDTSELSRLNQAPAFRRIEVSPELFHLLEKSMRLYQDTGGAWDGAIKPVFDLWGFSGDSPTVPSQVSINEALAFSGFGALSLTLPHHVQKQKEGLMLDLSSNAAGAAVDRIAAFLDAQGVSSYLVEITGEVRVKGKKPFFRPWKLGITMPNLKGNPADVYGVVSLKNDQALATSGDYHHYFQSEGQTYSHIIDPRTGYPISNHVASVTVIAPTCTQADGLSTALMVMGPRAGLAYVKTLQNVEALFLVREGDGFKVYHSPDFSFLE